MMGNCSVNSSGSTHYTVVLKHGFVSMKCQDVILWFTDPPQHGRFSPRFGGSGTQPF